MPPPPRARAKLPAVTTTATAPATAPTTAPAALKERPPQRKPAQLPPSNAAALAALRAGDKKPLDDPSKKESQDKVGNGAVAAGLARGPGADPKFAVLKKDIAHKKRTVARSHPPASKEATSAQDASVPPKDDEVAQGKTANAEKMNDAKPKDFDKEAFIKAVEKAIAEKAPKNLEQADEFSDSGKPAEVKAEVQGKVGEGKTDSAEQIASTTAAPPDTSAADVKQVVPMAADRPPGTPATPDPAKATPDKLPPSATDMSAGPANVNQEMTDNQVTEQQLTKSNEPAFGSALKDKKTAEKHSEATPPELRKNESQQLRQTTTQAKRFGTAAMGAIANQRVRTGQQVGGGKKNTKATDEEKRAQVTAILQKVFDTLKTDVEGILTGLDKLVDDQFTKGEKEARDAFTAEHRRKMDEYKDKRYSGGWGLVKWGHDKLFGLPEEANQIFVEARDNYVKRMRNVISAVADTIGHELTRAKQRIATGREELRKTVDDLPKDLKALGKQAAADFADKFDELTQSVDDKSTELVDTLATKYTDAVKSVDSEIAAEKEKNKGLVDKALDGIKGVIKTILELKDMLLGVLAKAAQAVMGILKDPIGFLGNLVSAVGGGLKLFKDNALMHLQQGVLSWLLGTAATAGIELPKSFDIVSILVLIASLLGLSGANLLARLARKLPKEAMTAIEAGEHALPIIMEVRKRGVRALWDDLKARVGDLKKNLIDNLVSYLLPTIITAGITWIISLFNPASAFIRACKMIIDIIKFIVTNGKQILEFVNTVLDAVIAIAKGGAGGVPALVEKALARSIPVLIGALAALLGVGGIAGKVKEVFQKLARPVNKAIDWVIDKIVGLAKKVWAKIKALAKKLKDKLKAAGKKVKDKFKKDPKKDKKKPEKKPKKDTPSAEERRQRDLERAARDLPPKIRAMLGKGVAKLRLRLSLLQWRLTYRLRKLALEGSGEQPRVVAANSPEKTLVERIISSSGPDINRMLRELSESIMTDREVRRRAAEIMRQRRGGAGTAVAPILMAGGYGGAPGALDLREQAKAGPGAPGVREVGPGGMFTAVHMGRGRSYPQEEHVRLLPGGPVVREVAAGSLHPGNVVVAGPVGTPGQGSYSKIAADPPGDPQLFMKALFAVQGGEQPPAGLTSEQLARVTELARLSQVESARSASGLVSERLGTHLAAEGELPWEERYGKEDQPMVKGGSGAAGRRATRALGLPPTAGLGEGVKGATDADVTNFLRMELELVRKFVEQQVKIQGELFDNETALRNYLDRHLRDHLKAILFH